MMVQFIYNSIWYIMLVYYYYQLLHVQQVSIYLTRITVFRSKQSIHKIINRRNIVKNFNVKLNDILIKFSPTNILETHHIHVLKNYMT